MSIYDYSPKPAHNLASRIAQAMLPVKLNHFTPEGAQPNRFDYIRKVHGIRYVLGHINDNDIKGAMSWLGAAWLVTDVANLSQLESACDVLLRDRMSIIVPKTMEVARRGDTVLYTPQLSVGSDMFQRCVLKIR
jgi:hypothetical protein